MTQKRPLGDTRLREKGSGSVSVLNYLHFTIFIWTIWLNETPAQWHRRPGAYVEEKHAIHGRTISRYLEAQLEPNRSYPELHIEIQWRPLTHERETWRNGRHIVSPRGGRVIIKITIFFRVKKVRKEASPIMERTITFTGFEHPIFLKDLGPSIACRSQRESSIFEPSELALQDHKALCQITKSSSLEESQNHQPL